jgi:hypothetical protein
MTDEQPFGPLVDPDPLPFLAVGTTTDVWPELRLFHEFSSHALLFLSFRFFYNSSPSYLAVLPLAFFAVKTEFRNRN